MLRFDVRALTPEMGVVVALVRPGPVPRPNPGLRVGDIIREIDQEPVRTMADFERLVDAVKPGDWLAVLVAAWPGRGVRRGRGARDLQLRAAGHAPAHETAARGCRHGGRGLSQE